MNQPIELQEAFNKGNQAYFNLQTLAANPYQEPSKEYDAWRAGWKAANER